MKKILVISDSFKGTLSSEEVGRIAAKVFNNRGYFADYLSISDGGEGFVDAISSATDLNKFSICVDGPLEGMMVEAEYLYDEDNATAYVELAQESGIIYLNKEQLNPFKASTFGVGQVIKHCIEHHNTKKICLGIGGSASVDMGAGLLEALGTEFFDKDCKKLSWVCNEQLGKVETINCEQMYKLTEGVEFVIFSDVMAYMFGNEGSVAVYAPQKGADTKDLEVLDNNCIHFHNVVSKYEIGDCEDFKGAGAAGGVGYGLVKFLGCKIVSGIQEFLRIIRFDELVDKYDIIVSGEGCYDKQTLQGKVISGIMKYNPKRLIILTGVKELEDGNEVYAIVPEIADMDMAIWNSNECLEKLCYRIKI